MRAFPCWQRQLALVLFLCMPPVLAYAQAPAASPAEICDDEKVAPADRRAACTSVIDNPATSPGQRADAFYNRGDAAADANDHDAAIADLTAAIALKADHSAAYILRGNSYDAKGDLDKALADYNEAIRLDPNDATGYFNRAEVYLAKGDRERAAADYNMAIGIDANHDGAREGLAELNKAK